MAFSSSAGTPELKYDVYLSFGYDTRNNFTSHLLAALHRANIGVFADNERIKIGYMPSILRAIQESRISIVILSKGYASSTFCLDELEAILDCRRKYGQAVIPVFYHVDPFEIRRQRGIFADTFAELKERFDRVERWKDALTEACDTSGYVIDNSRPEAPVGEEIVRGILEKLNFLYPTDYKNLLGVESSIKKIESLLRIGSKDVCIVGIWGMGGIGKTAIAKAVFDKIFWQFESCYFAENVWQESEKGGLIRLRKELFSTILKDEHINIRSTFTKERLQRRKFLIVLDDVTSLEQMEQLIGDIKCLAFGARVIITSRDRQLLKRCGVDGANIFEVQRLCDDHAFELFRRSAFRQNDSTADCMKVSNRVLTYAQGVPLALKVLGSFLLGKRQDYWECEIDKLENRPHEDIQKVLKRSYDELHDEEKNIFLDIACFFNKWNKCLVEEILDASYFSPKIGISTIIDKALITLSHNNITMNGLLQGMGKKIVQEQSMKDPSKRSRLWHPDDVYLVLTNNKGSEAIEGICLDMSRIREMHLKSYAFSNMTNLRFLHIYNSECQENDFNKLHDFEGLEFDFKELRYLGWHGYPSKSLPKNFCPKNLVALDMPNSNLERVSISAQNLLNLKYIDLGNSKDLVKSLYLSLIPNLRSINLNNCGITELPCSLGQLSSLEYLYLAKNNFESVPMSIINLTKLIMLHVSNCKRLQSLPKLPCHLEQLQAQGCTSLQTLSGLPNLKPRLKTVIFNFINCFQLDPSTLKDIVKDVLLNNQKNTTLWLEAGERLDCIPRGFLCFPGDEILESLNFQSTTSSIELPRGSLNCDLIGLAFCTVLSFHDYDYCTRDLITVHYELFLKSKDGSSRKVTCGFVRVWDDVSALDDIESDHILLGYDYNMCKHEFCNFSYDSEGIINFYVSNNDRIPSKHCDVKKCGVRLSYTQDSGKTVEDSNRHFLSDKEKREELHCKSRWDSKGIMDSTEQQFADR